MITSAKTIVLAMCFLCLCRLTPASADVLVSGHFANNENLVRLNNQGDYIGGWGGLYESVDGMAVGPNDIVYTIENRIGTLTVRGWNAPQARPVAMLTTPSWNDHREGYFTGAKIALGADSVFVAGYHFDPIGVRSLAQGAGIVRLNLNQFIYAEDLEPTIAYGTAGMNVISDLTVAPNGSLFVASDVGLLTFDGESGLFTGTLLSYSSSGIAAPTAIDFGTDGLLYVMDGGNSLKTVNPATGEVIATPFSADQGIFNAGRDMDVALDGTVYVLADSGGKVLHLSPSTGDVLYESSLASVMEPWSFPTSIGALVVPEPNQVAMLLAGLGLLLARHIAGKTGPHGGGDKSLK